MRKLYKNGRIQMYLATDDKDCDLCFHSRTENCSVAHSGRVCRFWWKPGEVVPGSRKKRAAKTLYDKEPKVTILETEPYRYKDFHGNKHEHYRKRRRIN